MPSDSLSGQEVALSFIYKSTPLPVLQICKELANETCKCSGTENVGEEGALNLV